jgi:hypothetical protein
MLKPIIILIIFLLGLYFVTTYPTYEAFTNKNYRCPNILFQKGSDYFLYNSKIAKVPGVNPLQFKNLEEYVEFTEWQRRQGIKCPILYVQEAQDTQGNTVYKARPSPTDMHGGLPDLALNGANNMPTANNIMPAANNIMPAANNMPAANDESKLLDAGRDDQPYNVNGFPGFDGGNQYIGLDTPLDKMYNENKGSISPNPMDTNWGGAKYTQALIDKGYYKDNEVAIRIN